MNAMTKPIWGILPTVNLRAIVARCQSHDLAEATDAFRSAIEQAVDGGMTADGTAHICIIGTIVDAPAMWCVMEGLTPPSVVSAVLRKYEADPKCKAITFVFDSPGGAIDGIPELADRVRASKKITTAFVRGYCCSAAYWLASQCGQIVATRGSNVGCLGVYAVYWDTSAQMKKDGIDVRIFSTSELKGAGEYGLPITEAQAKMFQRHVDASGKIFAEDVKRGRPDFDTSNFNGDYWYAEEALDRGLIDDIVIA